MTYARTTSLYVAHACAQMLRCIQLFVTPWTVACQSFLSMGFSGQEYWSGLPFPSPGALPDPGIEPVSSAWQVDSLPLCHLGSPVLLTQLSGYSSYPLSLSPSY